MFHAEEDLFHRHATLAQDAGGIHQQQAGQQAQDQMPKVCALPRHLAGLRGQQVLQGPKTVFNPAASPPGPDQPRRRHGRLPAQQVVPVPSRLLDDDHRHPAIAGAGHRESSIAEPRQLGAVMPGPVVPGQPVLARRAAPIRQPEDVRTLALHQQGALLGGGHMLQDLRVAKPAIGDDQGWWQPPTPPLQGRPGAVQHDLQPPQLVAAGPARPYGIGTAHLKVHRHHQFPLPDNHEQQQAIDPEPDAMVLAAIPGAYQAQLRAILFEDAVVPDPRPLPPTLGGWTGVLDVPPEPHQQLLAQALQAPDPLPLGQGAQDAARQVLIPAPHPTQLAIAATAERRGETSSQKSCPITSAGPAVATAPLRRWSLAARVPARPVPGLASGAAPAPALVGAAHAPCPGGVAWLSAVACDIVWAGSWVAPPFRCCTTFLAWRRP